MSSVQLDGSHTVAKRGGQAVAYQGRKKAKTTNMLFLTDSRGIPLVCGEAVGGNHNDAYGLEKTVDGMLSELRSAQINTKGLFLNADAGFDITDFRKFCQKHELIPNIDRNKRNGTQAEYIFDGLLYKRRFVIERTNAWIDAFKALLVRFETNKIHWKALHYMAFICIFARQL